MKRAVRNFNQYSPSRERWNTRESERLDHIQLKRQLRAKKEAKNDDERCKPDDGRSGVHGSVPGE